MPSKRRPLPLLPGVLPSGKLAADRSCGTCDACCTTHGVDELDKPAAVRCDFVRARHENASAPDQGEGACSIYADRPASCRDWSCLWRFGMFGADDRPDKLGVVMDLTGKVEDLWPGPTHQAFIARGAHPAAFEDPKMRAWLQDLARNHIVLLIIDARTSASLLPVHGPLVARRVMIGPPELLEYVQVRMRQKGLA